jgi:arabinose-5-phosphate isomerase
MTPAPKTIRPQALAAEAVAMMNQSERPFTVVFVLEGRRPVGALHLHDCLRAGVV